MKTFLVIVLLLVAISQSTADMEEEIADNKLSLIFDSYSVTLDKWNDEDASSTLRKEIAVIANSFCEENPSLCSLNSLNSSNQFTKSSVLIADGYPMTFTNTEVSGKDNLEVQFYVVITGMDVDPDADTQYVVLSSTLEEMVVANEDSINSALGYQLVFAGDTLLTEIDNRLNVIMIPITVVALVLVATFAIGCACFQSHKDKQKLIENGQGIANKVGTVRQQQLQRQQQLLLQQQPTPTPPEQGQIPMTEFRGGQDSHYSRGQAAPGVTDSSNYTAPQYNDNQSSQQRKYDDGGRRGNHGNGNYDPGHTERRAVQGQGDESGGRHTDLELAMHRRRSELLRQQEEERMRMERELEAEKARWLAQQAPAPAPPRQPAVAAAGSYQPDLEYRAGYGREGPAGASAPHPQEDSLPPRSLAPLSPATPLMSAAPTTPGSQEQSDRKQRKKKSKKHKRHHRQQEEEEEDSDQEYRSPPPNFTQESV